ncbi:hypothetical protein CBR_g31774 [Chara braunii]|uniref:Uncharacterized protein n=1 Tax=Chara braunii TaxID=69332 RepID=A0A388JYA5_CHABU|nr:hypothetical protein CBR_g31774 [Chara braunii]|eukprot:GBG62757.1 hypothetical protein CBR_g31774 [Chara braunii]
MSAAAARKEATSIAPYQGASSPSSSSSPTQSPDPDSRIDATSVTVEVAGSTTQPSNVHYSHRSPWLRAGVLGANDGLISTSSLLLGVSAVEDNQSSIVFAGLAAVVAGALSMAIGEFVSVYSQRDTEQADLDRERMEHQMGPESQARELEELAQIYVRRGLRYSLAKQVAVELTRVDPIRAHARDELGIDLDDLANPFQAAAVSAIAFGLGGIIPLLSCAFISKFKVRTALLLCVTTAALCGLGTLGAKLGGATIWRAALRVTVGGWIAMSITYGVLRVSGTAV